MTGSQRFPKNLRNSAVARWSHRDPVEKGNPFPNHNPCHHEWEIATRHAIATLDTYDSQLAPPDMGPFALSLYQERLVALAVTRFDTWAQRGLSVVRNQSMLRDYEDWLTTYAANWLVYVVDTCPHVNVTRVLRERLAAHVKQWTLKADTQLQ